MSGNENGAATGAHQRSRVTTADMHIKWSQSIHDTWQW